MTQQSSVLFANSSSFYCLGERPDTVHISDLPCKWFSDRHKSTSSSGKPSETIIDDVFSQFGDIRCMDVPILDPYR